MLGPVLAVVFGLGWIPLFVFRAEAMQDALPHYSAREQRWVKLAPAVVAGHVTLACVLVSLSTPSFARAACGLALFAAALAFWFWARAQIGSLRRTRLPDEPPEELRQTGPFGLVRNPLYFAYLMAAAAPAVVAGAPLLAVTYAACVGVLAVRAAQEERRLHAQLGPAYADYCRRVKRLIPYVW